MPHFAAPASRSLLNLDPSGSDASGTQHLPHVGAPRFRPVLQPVDPLEIQPVGNYAITLRWSDGHATGIYRFDFLRDISPGDS